MPEINEKTHGLKRTDKIDDHLYNDAMRRRNKSNEPPTAPEDSKRDNSFEDMYLLKKFEHEFNDCFADIDKAGKGTLDYETLCKLLKQFGCLSSAKDEEVLPELWKAMDGEKREGVSKANLKTVLMAILHIRLGLTFVDTAQGVQFTPEGAIQFSEKEAAALHKRFYCFYINCRYNVCIEQGDGALSGEYTFKPQISKKTEVMAATVRSKLEGDTLEEKLYQQHKKTAEYRLIE